MKAGLVTFHYAHHYGAQLQAYALMTSVKKQNIDCEIVDYVRKDTIDGSSLFQGGLNPRSLLKNVHSLLNYPSKKRRYNRFMAFMKTRMSLSNTAYRSRTELENNPPNCDCFLCGSDQVWNPVIYTEKDFDPTFFMDFTDRPKIAYAPSFGISSIPEDKTDKLKGYLDTFTDLSVREDTGAKIIKDITDKDVPVVLDPTLLLTDSDWSDLCSKPVIDEPYMLCYFVTDASAYFHQIEAVAKRTGLKAIWLSGNRLAPKGFDKIKDAGPEEFLSLFKHASYVCTNSFHGTVFSIIFKRDFACFSNLFKYKDVDQGSNMLNSRVYTLLNKLGITSQYISEDITKSDSSLEAVTNPIDYTSVDDALNKERQASLAFLISAIEKAKVMK